MSQVIPFLDVTGSIDWNDDHSPNDRPNPIYSKQIIDYNANGLMLGYITLASNNTACWESIPTMPLDWALPLAKELDAAGKKVGISFGGTSNKDISTQFTIEELEKFYHQTIELYKASYLDFDLEIQDFYNSTKICRALSTVTSKNPNVKISFTLPVSPSGLTLSALSILKDAKICGINFIVNGIVVGSNDPNYNDKMGDAVIETCTSMKNQLKELYPHESDTELYGRIAVTPMIGLNDDDMSMFTISDAEKVAKFCGSNSLSFLSHWDLNRDNPPSSLSSQDAEYTTSSNPNQKTSGEYTITMVQNIGKA